MVMPTEKTGEATRDMALVGRDYGLGEPEARVEKHPHQTVSCIAQVHHCLPSLGVPATAKHWASSSYAEHEVISGEALCNEVAYLGKECKVTDNCQPSSKCPSGMRTRSA